MNIENILVEIDNLNTQLQLFRHLQSYKIAKAFELEYTYESNRIEGNTLTLQETTLIIEKGLTIGGKTMQEHLEAINHTQAIEYIKELVTHKTNFTETILLNIHKLVLQGIDNNNAGTYRNLQVLISGAKHIPPQPYLVAKQMEDFFIWYNDNQSSLHPVILSALAHQKLVTIHPFIDGNGRTSRLLMNLILLQNNYPIAILKGDVENRLQYYAALEQAQTNNNTQPFVHLIANNVKATLQRVLEVVK
jgi:Fic family protein